MAPKSDAVYVVYEKTDGGDVIFAEASLKKENADAAAEKLKGEGKANIEVSKVDLDPADGKAKKGKGKAKKEKADSTNEEAMDDAEEEEPAKPQKSKKKAAAPKTAEDVESERTTIPDGKEGSLKGLKMLFTGTLAINRKTSEATAVTYGAKIVTKLEDTDYIILGTKPGPKKVEQIKNQGLKTISEDEFYEMVKGGGAAEPAKKKVKK